MALLLVLIVISAGGMLSMRFLQVAGMRSTMAQSLVSSREAEYLAESGVAEAAYWLRHPELTGGAMWTGVANRQPFGTADYYNVTVTQDPGNPRKLTVQADGHAMQQGQEVMARTVKAEFLKHYGFPDAVTTPCDLMLPQSATVLGNVYACTNLDNRGYVDGSVWVGGAVANSGTILGKTYLGAAVRAIGAYPVTAPVIYMYKDILYAAELIPLETIVNQAAPSSAVNPMGVWHRSGNLYVGGTTQGDGTVIVSGDMHLMASSVTTITAKAGFPALVVQGNLILDGDASNTTLNGMVIVHGKIQSTGSMPNTRLKIKGGLLFATAGGGFDATFSAEPKITIEHDATRTDVSGLYTSQPQWTAGVVQVRYREDGL